MKGQIVFNGMNKGLLRHSFSLLNIDHVILNDQWDYRNVISPYIRVYYIDEGEGWVSTISETTKLEPGYMYLIPSFTLCNLKCGKHLSQYFMHLFEESGENISLFQNVRRVLKFPAAEWEAHQVRHLLRINPSRGINRSDNPKVYEKNAYYRHYQELNNRVGPSTYMETQGIILQIISWFLKHDGRHHKTEDPIPSKVLDAMNYIQMNLKETLTVDKLAVRANLHKDYFSRLFLKFTGERPSTYIQGKRIERAQYLIATTNQTFRAIAEEVGFETLPYFSKTFKAITSLTPAEYKKQNNQKYLT